ncbi:MAG: hypothetical protein QXR98_04280 [Fervidicoccaceae archaeon]
MVHLPIQLESCSGVIGLSRGIPKMIKAERLLIDHEGLSFSRGDRSGTVLDCRKGFVVQSFFNGFSDSSDFPISSHGIDSSTERSFFRDSLILGWGGGIFRIRRSNGKKEDILLICPLNSESMNILEQREASLSEEKMRESGCIEGIFIERVSSLNENDIEKLKRRFEESNFYFVVKTLLTSEELFSSIEKTGKTPIDHLLSENLLNEKTIIVGGDWLTNRDVEAIRSQHSWIAHLPAEASYTGSGSNFPLIKFVSSSYWKLMIGTGKQLDSPLFLSSLSLLLYRFMTWSTAIDESTVLRMLWSGWELLGKKIACIDEGCQPILLVYDKNKIEERSFTYLLGRRGYTLVPRLICSSYGCINIEREDLI